MKINSKNVQKEPSTERLNAIKSTFKSDKIILKKTVTEIGEICEENFTGFDSAMHPNRVQTQKEHSVIANPSKNMKCQSQIANDSKVFTRCEENTSKSKDVYLVQKQNHEAQFSPNVFNEQESEQRI